MNSKTTHRFEIKKNAFGDFQVFRYGLDNWPNYVGQARSRRGAVAILENAQKPSRQEWLPCGDGVGMPRC